MSTERARQRGVTLVELIMFIVIIGVALGGLLQVLSLAAKNSADPVRQKQALMLAESLLEEVQLSGFTYCDPTDESADTAANWAACSLKEEFGQGVGNEPVGPRPYDNINDYVSAANTSEAAFDIGGFLSDASGARIDVNGYEAALTISPAVLNGIGAAGTSANTDVLRITVEISYHGEKLLALDAYRTRYAPNSP